MTDRVSVTWGTRREGNDGYVQETHTNQHGDVLLQFEKKMPANVVPAYVEGRRRIVATKALEADHSFVEPNLDYLAGGESTKPRLIN